MSGNRKNVSGHALIYMYNELWRDSDECCTDRRSRHSCVYNGMYIQWRKSMKRESFRKGMKDGVPIALGYFAVSFTFGMMAVAGQLADSEAQAFRKNHS